MFQRKPLRLKTYGRNNVSVIDVGCGKQPTWKALLNKKDDFDDLFFKSTRTKDLKNNVSNASYESSPVVEVIPKPTAVTIKTLLIDRSLEDEGKLSNVKLKKRNCVPKKRNYVPKKVAKKKKSTPQKIDRNNDTVSLDSTPEHSIAKEQDHLQRKSERQKNNQKNQNENLPIEISIASETTPSDKECLVDFDQSTFRRTLRSTKRPLVNKENEKQSEDSSLEFVAPKPFITVRKKNKENVDISNTKKITARKNENVSILNKFTRKTRSQGLAEAKLLETNSARNSKSRLNITSDLPIRCSIDDFDLPGALRTQKKQKISITLSEDETADEISNSQKINNQIVNSNNKLQQSFSNVDRTTTIDQVTDCNLSLPEDQNTFVKPQTILRKNCFLPVISTPINGKCEIMTKFKKNLGGVHLDTPSPIPNLGQTWVPVSPSDSDIEVVSSNSASTKLDSITSNLSGILEEPSKLDESSHNTAQSNKGESSHNTTQSNKLNISERVEIRRNLFRMTILDVKDNNEFKDFEISALLTGSKDLGKKLSETEEILKLCNQEDIWQFNDLFEKRLTSQNVKKISEGTFSEVFKIKFGNEWFVAKIIPVGGKNPLDGENNMSLKAVLTEIIISESLSKLREASQNSCSTFIQLFETKFVRGPYPKALISAWKDYETENETENYNPVAFDKDQLYVVLKYEDGGKDLEHTLLSKYLEVLSVYCQLSCALAIAEKSLNFEHRDLHLGNVLISKTKDKFINFVLEGKTITVETSGVQVRIIDHTLSRLRLNNVNMFTNLSEYDIFNGTGDRQYDVYREMKAISKDNWEYYHPETNVLWLNFVLEKMMKKIKKPTSTMVLFEQKTFLKERSSAFECMQCVIP